MKQGKAKRDVGDGEKQVLGASLRRLYGATLNESVTEEFQRLLDDLK